MFYSLIKKDKHLLFLIVSDNIFNFPLLECSTEGHSESTPQHSLRVSCWERSSAIIQLLQTASQLLFYILILPLVLLINYKYLLLCYNSMPLYNCFVPITWKHLAIFKKWLCIFMFSWQIRIMVLTQNSPQLEICMTSAVCVQLAVWLYFGSYSQWEMESINRNL